MELIDLVFDQGYFDILVGCNNGDWQGSLELYKREAMLDGKCIAPNELFAKEELLLYFNNAVREKECSLSKWLKKVEGEDDWKVLQDYLYGGLGGSANSKLNKLEDNLKQITKYQPQDLRVAFTYKLLKERVIKIITDYTIKDSRDCFYSEFLIGFIKQDAVEPKHKDYIINRLLQVGIAPVEGVACLSMVGLFEELISNNEYTELALAGIYNILGYMLIHDGYDECFAEIEKKITQYLNDGKEISDTLINAVIESQKNHRTFTEVLCRILADYKDLPKSINLGALTGPIIKLAQELADISEIKQVLFIANKLLQYHVVMPDEAILYIDTFKKFLFGHSSEVQRLALKLYQDLRIILTDDNKIKAAQLLEAFYQRETEVEDSGTVEEQWEEFIDDINIWRLGIPASYIEVLLNSVNRLWDLKWEWGYIASLLDKHRHSSEALQALVVSLEKLSDYSVTLKMFDRHGTTAKEMLDSLLPPQWSKNIQQLINDNHFFISKSRQELLDEMRVSNANNDNILQLIEENYFTNQLDKIAKQLADEELRDWKKADFTAWRGRVQQVSDENIAEVMAVLSQAIKNTYGFYPREAQLISVLALFKSPNGGLAQISTGEGKSLIIAMFAITQVMSGRQIDTVTSSAGLAKRDVKDQEPFYNLFGITVDHNIAHSGDGPKACYSAHIVYGDLLNFIGDSLRDTSSNTKLGRGFDLVIVDEVDNMFIDQNNMKVQLSGLIPGFEGLKQVLVYMWGIAELGNSNLFHDEDGKCYLKQLLNEQQAKELGEEELLKPEQFNLLPINQTCLEYLKSYVANYTENTLLDYKQTRAHSPVVIPHHLEEFALRHVLAWVDSIMNAYGYQEKSHYIVEHHPKQLEQGKKLKVIAPIDYKNTGEIQYGLHWTDGLHQFLEIKHSLTLHSENLISIFMSYLGYFDKYKGNIYGLTGTLGEKAHHNFLHQVYGVDLITVPQFIAKDLTECPPIIKSNKVQWQQSIIDIINRKVSSSRVALIIVESIAEVEGLARVLIESGYNPSRVWMYTTGNAEQEKIIEKRVFQAGDVVIATNLAGRGTDLKISHEVNKNGGLHVILGSFADSIRIHDQAYGRGARKGEAGSAQLVLNAEHLVEMNCGQDIDCLYKKRHLIEIQELEEERLCDLPNMEILDYLFNLYVDLVKEINSPTGYKIEIIKPASTVIAAKTFYLYQESEQIKLQISDANAVLKEIDLSELLFELDPKVAKHISGVLKGKNPSSNINQQDYELINFIAAINGYSDYQIIYKRVLAASSKEITTGPPQEWQQKHPELSDQDSLYFYWKLSEDKAYEHLKSDNKLTPELIKKAKLRQLYLLWLEDRALYNNQYEIKQVGDLWAIWLKNQTLVLFEEHPCQIDTEQEKAELRKYQEAKKQKLTDNFKTFKEQIKDLVETKKLMHNPSHLVHKAWHYLTIEGTQRRANPPQEIENAGWFTNFGNMISNLLNSWFGFGNYEITRPLDDAIGFLNQAIDLDAAYNWPAHNAMSYIRLLRDGEGITQAGQAQGADRVKLAFYSDARAASSNITEYAIPQIEGQLSFLLMQGLVDIRQDLAIQLFGHMQVYHKIIDVINHNIEILASAQGDQMIRVGRSVSLEGLVNNINITEIIIQKLNTTESLKADSFQAMFNLTAPLNFTSSSLIISEINALGGLLFEIEVYQLEEEEDEWFGTVFSAILGVAQICLGVMLLSSGIGGLAFTSVFAKGMIFAGIGDIISSVTSIINGVPINLDQYFKAKGIGYAITLLTAGVAQLGNSILLANGEPFLPNKLFEAGDSWQTLMMKQTAVHILGAGLYNVGKRIFIDVEDMEAEVRAAVESLIRTYSQALNKIFASDQWQSVTTLQSHLERQAQAIMNHYQKRFGDDATKIGVGVGVSTLGMAIGQTPFSTFGNIFSKTTTAALGGIKSLQALDRFSNKMGGTISDTATNAIPSRTMMSDALSKEFGQDISAQLMALLQGQGFITAQEINYQNCNAIDGLSLNGYNKAAHSICDQIAIAIANDYQSKKDSFAQYLVSLLTGHMVAINKNDLIRPLANEFAGDIVEQAVKELKKAQAEAEAEAKAGKEKKEKPKRKAPDGEAIKKDLKAEAEAKEKAKQKAKEDRKNKQSGNCPGDGPGVCNIPEGKRADTTGGGNKEAESQPKSCSVDRTCSKPGAEQEPYGPPVPPEVATQAKNKPTIELIVRDVIPGAKHGFTIFTDSNGEKTIITGFPEENTLVGAFTSNLKIVDALYTEVNSHLLGKDWATTGDYKNDKKYKIIMTTELNNDQELQTYLFKAREVVQTIEKGNNGGRYDYDICFSDNCWGGNSNTLQKAIHEAMGFKIEVPEKINMPGINGKFYDGPFDDFMRKYGEALQKERAGG